MRDSVTVAARMLCRVGACLPRSGAVTAPGVGIPCMHRAACVHAAIRRGLTLAHPHTRKIVIEPGQGNRVYNYLRGVEGEWP